MVNPDFAMMGAMKARLGACASLPTFSLNSSLQNVVDSRPAMSPKSFLSSVAARILFQRHTSIVTFGVMFEFPSLFPVKWNMVGCVSEVCNAMKLPALSILQRTTNSPIASHPRWELERCRIKGERIWLSQRINHGGIHFFQKTPQQEFPSQPPPTR